MEHSFGTRLIGFWYEFDDVNWPSMECGHHSRECGEASLGVRVSLMFIQGQQTPATRVPSHLVNLSI